MTFNHDYYKKRSFDDRMEDITFGDIDDIDIEYLTQGEKCGRAFDRSGTISTISL